MNRVLLLVIMHGQLEALLIELVSAIRKRELIRGSLGEVRNERRLLMGSLIDRRGRKKLGNEVYRA